MGVQQKHTKMIFTFRCRNCNKEFEVESPIGTSPAKPECCGDVVRVWNPLGTRYRCSGFYQTDKVLYDK